MLRDSDTPRYAVRRTKRTYSADTKAELMAACRAPGASIAAVASANGMNANVLHRWLKDQPRSTRHQTGNGACTDAAILSTSRPELASFIPLPLPIKPPEPVEREIKVDVRSGSLVMTITWPLSAASDFAHWSACVLK